MRPPRTTHARHAPLHRRRPTLRTALAGAVWFLGITTLALAAPRITVEAIPAPAAKGASGASLVDAPDGTVWLSWIEPAAGAPKQHALRFSRFDAAASSWSPARTIAQGPDWFVNWADFPTLTVGEGGAMAAVWFVNHPAPPAAAGANESHDHHGPGYRAFISRSSDGGNTWSAATPLTRESDSVEFVSLATLADGRVLAAWLDGRARKQGKPQQLYSRIVGDAGPDLLVDASVCDCCQTALTAFPDGSALLAYRGRDPQEVRDIRVRRFRNGSWDTPRPPAADGWRIPGCPVNGPQLASDGGRVAIAWFTAADNDPRVLASYSPDAGGRFLLPLRMDATKPAGRVDTVLLRDGALLVTWLAVDGTLWLRRISPELTTDEPMALAQAAEGRAGGFPRTTRLRDYHGGRTTAQLLSAFAREGAEGGIGTLLITVPEGELLEASRNCDCAPTAEQLRGFSLRGSQVSMDPANATMRVQHAELPGIFPAGTREFRVEPAVVERFEAGRPFFGRVERRDGQWWLFDVRFLARTP